jgi:hypothetical protein
MTKLIKKNKLTDMINQIHGENSDKANSLINALPKDTIKLLNESGWPQSGFYRDYIFGNISAESFHNDFVKKVHAMYAKNNE